MVVKGIFVTRDRPFLLPEKLFFSRWIVISKSRETLFFKMCSFILLEAWSVYYIFRELWKDHFIFRDTWSISPLPPSPPPPIATLLYVKPLWYTERKLVPRNVACVAGGIYWVLMYAQASGIATTTSGAAASGLGRRIISTPPPLASSPLLSSPFAACAHFKTQQYRQLCWQSELWSLRRINGRFYDRDD